MRVYSGFKKLIVLPIAKYFMVIFILHTYAHIFKNSVVVAVLYVTPPASQKRAWRREACQWACLVMVDSG